MALDRVLFKCWNNTLFFLNSQEYILFVKSHCCKKANKVGSCND